jgi:hypothetical protein
MQKVMGRLGLRIAVFLVLMFAASEMAQAQTVVFKQPVTVPQSCPFVAKALEARVIELKNVNAQLALRARQLEIQVAALKVVSVKKPKKQAQYCKRWKHHRCTWLARR